MIGVFAVVALVLCALTLRDEVHAGGSLSLRPDVVAHLDATGELLELPLIDGWTENDLLVTLAEIEALGSIELEELRAG